MEGNMFSSQYYRKDIERLKEKKNTESKWTCLVQVEFAEKMSISTKDAQ
jgi:hypothetical protein